MGRISSRFWKLPVSLGHVGMSQMGELLKPGSAGHNIRDWPNLLPSPCPTCPVTAQNTSLGSIFCMYAVHALSLASPAFLPWTAILGEGTAHAITHPSTPHSSCPQCTWTLWDMDIPMPGSAAHQIFLQPHICPR